MRSLRPWALAGIITLAAGVAGCGGSSTLGSHRSSGEPATSGSPTVVASGIPFAANLTFDGSGHLWVVAATLGPGPSEGVWYVPPGGHPVHVVGNLTAPTALTWLGDRLYVGSNTAVGKGEITVFEGFNGTSFAHRHVLIENLPVGSHTIGSIVQGPEGRLFVGLGALSDASGPPGGVQSFPANGGTRRVEATGLRTAFGLAFWGHKLVVTETGPEHVLKRGDALYAFEPGGPVVNFGFPECYGQGGTACAKFPAPLTTFPAHSTPTGVAVKGDDAFVADNGSAVPQVSAPSEIERVQLSSGQKSTFWRSPVNHNLVGVAIGPEGDLFATLFATGQVVRFKL